MDYKQRIKIIIEALKPAEPDSQIPTSPYYLYHATSLDNAFSITETGYLVPNRPWYGTDQTTWPDGSKEKRSYWSKDASVVWQFAPEGSKNVVLRTPINMNIFQRETTGDYITTIKILISDLEILATDNNWYKLETFFKPSSSEESHDEF